LRIRRPAGDVTDRVTLKILRLTNSNDFNPAIPEELRGAALTEAIVRAALDEPVETISRSFWPSERFPPILNEWLDRYEPDLVFIRSAAYWVSFESVPLRFERKLGWLGKWPAKVGNKIGSEPTIATNWLARRARRVAVRTIGGDTYFTPAAAAQHVEDMLRVIVTRESVVALVRGPGHTHNSAGTRSVYARAQRRNQAFEAELKAVCGRMRVAYVSAFSAAAASALSADDVHTVEGGERAFAEVEGPAIVKAWRGREENG